jgi:hypothetical protein
MKNASFTLAFFVFIETFFPHFYHQFFHTSPLLLKKLRELGRDTPTKVRG